MKTAADWIKAGELVFDAPIEFVASGRLFTEVRGTAWYEKNRVPITSDGVLPFMRYVIREKGKVELGILSCAMCHTRVMPDGGVIKGAQGNFPDDRTFAYGTHLEAAQATDKDESLKELRSFMRRSYAAPWLAADPNARPNQMTLDEIARVLEAIPPGVCARQGSSPLLDTGSRTYSPVIIGPTAIELISLDATRYLAIAQQLALGGIEPEIAELINMLLLLDGGVASI